MWLEDMTSIGPSHRKHTDGNTDCTRQGVAALVHGQVDGQVDYSTMGSNARNMYPKIMPLTDCLSPPSQVADEPAGGLAIEKIGQNQVVSG
jgi:hypothetical protein